MVRLRTIALAGACRIDAPAFSTAYDGYSVSSSIGLCRRHWRS
jgi:hypothetical protein